MSGIVVDASVTLSWCFPDELTAMSMLVLDRLQAGDHAIVPAFWSVEVLNTLLVGERRGRITTEQTATFLDNLQSLNPALDYASIEQIAGAVQIICRTCKLTPYDALYVELAQRTGFPLATLDGAQRKAAEALGIQCL